MHKRYRRTNHTKYPQVGISSHTLQPFLWSEYLRKNSQGHLKKTLFWTTAVYISIALKWCQTLTSEGKKGLPYRYNGRSLHFSNFPQVFQPADMASNLSISGRPGSKPCPGQVSPACWALPFLSLLQSRISVEPYQPVGLFFLLSVGFCFAIYAVIFLRLDQIKVIFYLNGKEQ